MDADRVEAVRLEDHDIVLHGFLGLPPGARGLVLFAHGSGSGRMSPRNQDVARHLRGRGLGTLLLDLLTEDEESLDRMTGELRFNIGFLARRLLIATAWVDRQDVARTLGVGYFGASTGAAAALVAAAMEPERIQAVVSRGGRPDLAAGYLKEVRAPTLLIVGSRDQQVLSMNQEALKQMNQASTALSIVPGASHLFEEAGALNQVAVLAEQWFSKFLGTREAAQTAQSAHGR